MTPAPKHEPAIDLEKTEHRLLYVGQDVDWFLGLKNALGLPANRLVYCAGESIAKSFLRSDIRYDLVLFDFDLLNETGWEMVRLVRSLAHRKQIPIIIAASD